MRLASPLSEIFPMRLFLCGLRCLLRERGAMPFLVLLVSPLSEIFPMRLFLMRFALPFA